MRRRKPRNRARREWQWAFQPSTGEAFLVGDDQVPGYRKMIEKRRAQGKPYGSLWRRCVTYGRWRAK